MDKQSSQKETFRSIWFKYHSLKTPYYFVLLQGRQISAKLAIFYKLIVLIFSGFLCYCQGQVQSTRTLQKLVGPSALYLVIRQIDRQIDRQTDIQTHRQMDRQVERAFYPRTQFTGFYYAFCQKVIQFSLLLPI